MKYKLIVLFILISFFNYGQNNIIQKIDSLINLSIKQKAFPGAQVYIKIKDSIVVNKSYGYQTYDSINRINNDHIYDLASLTKVLASTLSIMKLYEDFGLNLNSPLSFYFKDLKKSNKKTTTIIEGLSHTSGWIPYISHQNYVKRKNGEFKKSVIRESKNQRFSAAINERLYLNKNYFKKLFKRIKKSKINKKGEYVYSGLFFFYIPNLIKKLSGKTFEQYFNTSLLDKTNAKLYFNPKEKVKKELIVPTEYDSIFRKTLIHGNVHDEAASFMGGISGNAGLFGSAQEIGKLLQALEPNNFIFQDSTIKKFTSYAYKDSPIRRGLGFDKPYSKNEFGEYPNKNLSKQSFGHTGFTGTMFWVDPEKKLTIIFLTNRVYPTRNNDEFYQNNVRSKLIDLIIQKTTPN
ncbi:MAG: serine hydrolase [Bacteroidetes bacterium]|nr:serine hydrolase [Bacteroidota bacterium]MDA1019677.1 serine hydrolase [Bacteroidota bacterium]